MAGIEVKIGADTQGLEDGVRRSKSQLSQLGSEARAGASELAKWGAAAAAAGAAVAAGIVANAVAGSRELARMAQVSNTSTQEFQKLAFAAKSVGVEQDKFADILKDVNDRVGDFISTGGGPMLDFFEQIGPKVGVTAEDFRKLSGPDALQLYVSSLEKANVSQQEMTFYMEAMASDATALLPLLKNGGEAMAAQASEAERLGLALSAIEVEQMNQAASAMDRAASVAEGFANQLSAELSPIIAALSNQFIQAAEDAGGVGEAASGAYDKIVTGVGFVLDAVEGVRRVFEVAGKGIALFALGGVAAVLNLADKIVNGPVAAINELIEGFNSVPMLPDIEPIGASELGKDIKAQLDLTRGAIVEAQNDIAATMNEPLPSTAFKQFAADAKEEAEKSAREAIRIKEMLADASGSGDGEEGGGATAGISDDQKDAIRQRLERIQEGFASERDLTLAKYEQDNEDLRLALENKLITEQEWAALSKQAKQAEEAELTAIEQRESEKRKMLADQEAKAKLNAFSSAFGDLSTLMNTESRKMFEIGKAAALANALLSAKSAITGAYARGAEIGGPPLGAVFGAAAAAATFAQVQSIRAQSFGGSGGSAAAASTTSAVNAQSQGVAIQGQQQQAQQFNITLEDGAMFSAGQVRQLIGQINEQTSENGVVLVTGG